MNGNKKLWQTALDLFVDLRSKICLRVSYVEGVCNYQNNCAEVQLHILPVSPVHYTPKLGFSGQQGVHVIHRKLFVFCLIGSLTFWLDYFLHFQDLKPSNVAVNEDCELKVSDISTQKLIPDWFHSVVRIIYLFLTIKPSAEIQNAAQVVGLLLPEIFYDWLIFISAYQLDLRVHFVLINLCSDTPVFWQSPFCYSRSSTLAWHDMPMKRWLAMWQRDGIELLRLCWTGCTIIRQVGELKCFCFLIFSAPYPWTIRVVSFICMCATFYISCNIFHRTWERASLWSSCSMLDYRSLPPVFQFRRGHIWRLFHLWLRFITFGGRSAHLAYHVHKSGRKKINHHHRTWDLSYNLYLCIGNKLNRQNNLCRKL